MVLMEYPASLFKYSDFKNYSLEMMEKGHIYLCPASILDDQFECSASIPLSKNQSPEYILSIISEILNPYLPNQQLDANILSCYDMSILNQNKFIDYIVCQDKSLTRDNAVKVAAYLSSLSSNEIQKKIDDVLNSFLSIRNAIGVCSLATSNTNQVMWSMYAKNYEGYCIEYDIATYLKEHPEKKYDLHKVNYSDNRDTDIMKLILIFFYKYLFNLIGIDTVNLDINIKDAIIKLLTAKHTDWAFQNEWRFVGVAGDKSINLPIKAVYLGKGMSNVIKNMICRVAADKKITIYEQHDDCETLSVSFEKIQKNN